MVHANYMLTDDNVEYVIAVVLRVTDCLHFQFFIREQKRVSIRNLYQ